MNYTIKKISVPRFVAEYFHDNGTEPYVSRKVFASKVAMLRWIAWQIYYNPPLGTPVDTDNFKELEGDAKAAVLKEINRIGMDELKYAKLLYKPNLKCPECGWVGFFCETAGRQQETKYGYDYCDVYHYWNCPSCEEGIDEDKILR
jgi:hypothetical protein